MPTTALATFAAVLSRFRSHFTAPTFVRFILLVVGWLLTCDPSPGGCITEALRRKSKHRGRPRKMGMRLPAPATMHHDGTRRWTMATFQVSQRERQREVLRLKAQWYDVLGARTNHVVLMREDTQKLRVVLCTDDTLAKESILEQGARRWPIEVWNRDVKQIFGFADSP
jgi:hypothetical protein